MSNRGPVKCAPSAVPVPHPAAGAWLPALQEAGRVPKLSKMRSSNLGVTCLDSNSGGAAYSESQPATDWKLRCGLFGTLARKLTFDALAAAARFCVFNDTRDLEGFGKVSSNRGARVSLGISVLNIPILQRKPILTWGGS